MAQHNQRYARAAAAEADYHRRRPTPRQWDEVFWLEEERVVSEDGVVRYRNRLLQLERQSQRWAPSKSRVRVRETKPARSRFTIAANLYDFATGRLLLQR